jgi:hypothetical protein
MYTTAQHRAEWNIVLELGKHVISTLLALVHHALIPGTLSRLLHTIHTSGLTERVYEDHESHRCKAWPG